MSFETFDDVNDYYHSLNYQTFGGADPTFDLFDYTAYEQELERQYENELFFEMMDQMIREEQGELNAVAEAEASRLDAIAEEVGKMKVRSKICDRRVGYIGTLARGTGRRCDLNYERTSERRDTKVSLNRLALYFQQGTNEQHGKSYQGEIPW